MRQRIISVILIVLTFAALVGTVIASGFSTQYEIAAGHVCPEDIYATRTIIDTVTTQERRKAASDSVEDIYTTDFAKVDLALDSVAKALTYIRNEREAMRENVTSADESYIVKNGTYLSEKDYIAALHLSDADFDLLAEHAPDILQRVMTEGVTDTKTGIDEFNSRFAALNVSNSVVPRLADALCSGVIGINKTFNHEETEKQKEIAANAVSDVTYMKNQIIARKGEIITNAQLAMLKELGFVKGEIQIDIFHTVSVMSLLALVICLVVLYYITVGKKEIATGMTITTVICSSLTVIGALIILFAVKGSENLIYFMPLSLIPALIAMLLCGNLSCMVNIITAVLAGIQTNDLSIAISLILAGSATAYVFSRVRRRAHMLTATVISAFAYALSYSAIFIDTSKSVLDVFIIFAFSLAGGFFGGILTVGTIPFCEAIFDVITPMKLGELSNPEHKLLKKLLLNAPGSYHHSLTVANMAEAAAAAINANASLARVGAYYHDIGKMEDPAYFKENQFGDENPHDFLSPEESARIIIKHVSDGVHLATVHRLPTAVRDIIAQHHGTTTVSYFLYKAKKDFPDTDPALFTYPGPTPQTKEATIIMLADACEAAVRAMREKGSVDVKEVVDNLVSTRINEGQLASSNLTFSDLEKVKQSFVQTLEQYFHKRILYPQNEKKD